MKGGCTDTFMQNCHWDVDFSHTDDLVKAHVTAQARSLNAMSSCDLAWAMFLWDITGGFYFAVGVFGIPSTGTLTPGIVASLKSNPTIAAFSNQILVVNKVTLMTGITFLKVVTMKEFYCRF